MLATLPCGCAYDTETRDAIRAPGCTHKPNPTSNATQASKPGVVVSIKLGFARRKLDKELAFLLNAARSHENNGLPSGHSTYKGLYGEAQKLLDDFSRISGMPVERVQEGQLCLIDQFPAFYTLKAKALAPPPKPADPNADVKTKAKRFLAGVFGLPAVVALMVITYNLLVHKLAGF